MVKHKHTKEKKGPVFHSEDVAQKITAAFFGDDILPHYGLSGRVMSIAPTELQDIQVNNLYQDFNYVMEDGSWKHLEFESTDITLKDLKRFRAYEALASYQYEVDITTYIICSGKVQNPKSQFTSGMNTYRAVTISMGDRDAGAYIHTLQEKRECGGTITRSDLVWLALCPIMGGDMPQKERIQAALELIKNNGSICKEDKKTLEAVLYVLAAKFLQPSELEEIREVMQMTKLGELLVEEGRSQGLTEGREEGKKEGRAVGKTEGRYEGKAVMLTEIIRRKLAKGVSPDLLAELLEVDPVHIRKICTMVQEKPEETDLEIAQALLKSDASFFFSL
ncbi:MAG TPA: hypothetical protein IAA06_05160 [Candidatus Blautia faecavium]|uniref:Rpn family recombination-promoting nuclease/putative transposase n=1 Tax=Candidatus Blautia faecavium TaxID=2838487 RepID=A0A9D2RW59_9FIRM|nr:hypothetical protein [Candidatus Blautia faecavium]